MRRNLWSVMTAALIVVGCSSSSSSDEPEPTTTDATTTTATVEVTTTTDPYAVPTGCPSTIDFGETVLDPECRPGSLLQVLEGNGLHPVDDETAVDAAQAWCVTMDTAASAGEGIAAGILAVDAVEPVPEDEQGTFIAYAAAVMCPEHFDTLTELNG